MNFSSTGEVNHTRWKLILLQFQKTMSVNILLNALSFLLPARPVEHDLLMKRHSLFVIATRSIFNALSPRLFARFFPSVGDNENFAVFSLAASFDLTPHFSPHPTTSSIMNDRAAAGWNWFHALGSPRLWVAPLVGMSDIAFRMLCRRLGATCCHTQMTDAGGYSQSAAYRKLVNEFAAGTADRPLVFQLGGHDPRHMYESAKLAAPFCDAVELNMGCPQQVARKHHFGAFLMEDPEAALDCIRAIARALKEFNVNDANNNDESNEGAHGTASSEQQQQKPRRHYCATLVKIRCFTSVARTVTLARELVAAGAEVLTCHGRTRHMGGGAKTGRSPANFAWIRAVKDAIFVPVISNGNIRHFRDVAVSRKHTGADAIMSGVGALHTPALVFHTAAAAATATTAAANDDDYSNIGTLAASSPSSILNRAETAELYLKIVSDLQHCVSPNQAFGHLVSRDDKTALLPSSRLRRVPALRNLFAKLNNKKSPESWKALPAECQPLALAAAIARAASVLSPPGETASLLLAADSDDDEEECGENSEVAAVPAAAAG